MKNKKWIVLFMLLGVVVFAACNNSGGRGKEMAAETKEYIMEYAGEEAPEAIEPETDIVMQELVIYYSNGQADGLEAETVETEDIKPELIVSHLAKHNIVSIGTKVNQFDIVMEDGKSILSLDFSKAFGEYIGTMGSSGEAVIMAAITGTFLEAYAADAIRITVEGKTLETGHRIYDGLLTVQDVELGNVEDDL